MMKQDRHQAERKGEIIGDRRSFRGRLWELLPQDTVATVMISEAGAGAASSILAARGMPVSEAKSFVFPRIVELMPSPWFFQDMEAAADRVASAVVNKENICVWGDYDVDGATSSSIIRRWLRACGVNAAIYVPDRVLEGYGPNGDGLEMLRDEGVGLVIIVDSGTVAFEPLARAAKLNLDIVVIDHHAPEAELPDARAIVNPNRRDQKSGYGQLCAAGMAFIFVQALEIKLRARGYFSRVPAPDLFALTDLVAMGTVCDVVPLTGLNRAFVAEGLKIMAGRGNAGIRALTEVAGVFKDPLAWELGFILGPRINAGGRIGQSTAGSNLLFSDSEEECLTIAKALDHWNRERQEIEKRCVVEAQDAIMRKDGPDGFAMAASPDWHEGVIGIVASRLKDFFDVPSFCFSINGNMAKGSGRGVPGFDLGRAVIEAKVAGILTKGGGHPMAAGVSCPVDRLRDFSFFMRESIRKSGFLDIGIVTKIDVELEPRHATVALADAMAVMEPYGQGNPAPRFLIRNLHVARAGTGANNLLKIELVGPDSVRLEAPIFQGVGTPFGESMRDAVGMDIDIVTSLKVDEHRGQRKVRLQIEDARWSS